MKIQAVGVEETRAVGYNELGIDIFEKIAYNFYYG